MVRNIVEETRAGDRSQVTAEDEGRQFYQLHPAKRIVVMMAGPVMNLILAVGIFGVLMVGIGVPTQSTTVATVQPVRHPGRRRRRRRSRPNARAERRRRRRRRIAGLLPGDTIVGFDGTPVTSWTS